MNEIDHNFPSCSRTYATLRISHDTIGVAQISAALEIEPDYSFEKGQSLAGEKTAEANSWLITTRGTSKSRDVRFHIMELLNEIPGAQKKLSALENLGCIVVVHCFWGSLSGNGGPFLDHEFLKWLSSYSVAIDFDVWFEPSENR